MMHNQAELLAILTGKKSSPHAPMRATAGRRLGELGDPRQEIMTLEAKHYCFVPAGPFRMGSQASDLLTWANEKPQHDVDLPAFWIAR